MTPFNGYIFFINLTNKNKKYMSKIFIILNKTTRSNLEDTQLPGPGI